MVEISVIIPCYNASNYIEKCLKSLANQTFDNFEIVLVDDCSGDNTVEVVSKLIKKYNLNALLLQNGINVGPSQTRKNGICGANGEYITFCDSDDYYEIDFLQKMYEATNSKKHDVVFCNYNAVYSNGEIRPHNNVRLIKNEEKRAIVAKSADSLCCMMIRKTLLTNIEFPEVRNGEDMAIIPIINSRACGFGFVEDFIYNYVYRENSLSKKYTPEMILSLKKSFEYIENNVSPSYADEIEYLGIKNYLYAVALNMFKNEKMLPYKSADEIIGYFTNKYPLWDKNKYCNSLPIYKKIYLFAIKYRLYFLCRILSSVHKKISR